MVRNLISNAVNSETADELQPVKMQYQSVTYQIGHHLSSKAYLRGCCQNIKMVERILT
jgi:hypothetical protein